MPSWKKETEIEGFGPDQDCRKSVSDKSKSEKRGKMGIALRRSPNRTSDRETCRIIVSSPFRASKSCELTKFWRLSQISRFECSHLWDDDELSLILLRGVRLSALILSDQNETSLTGTSLYCATAWRVWAFHRAVSFLGSGKATFLPRYILYPVRYRRDSMMTLKVRLWWVCIYAILLNERELRLRIHGLMSTSQHEVTRTKFPHFTPQIWVRSTQIWPAGLLSA
jgi:hypothetical protein